VLKLSTQKLRDTLRTIRYKIYRRSNYPL
jgi:hypothetical protein